MRCCNESRVRLAAARALIATGIDVPSDVAAVLDIIHKRGVRQEGQRVMLLPGAPIRTRMGRAGSGLLESIPPDFMSSAKPS